MTYVNVRRRMRLAARLAVIRAVAREATLLVRDGAPEWLVRDALADVAEDYGVESAVEYIAQRLGLAPAD